MKLHQLEVQDFGILTTLPFEFDPSGFQLIAGPNEAGKSTFLQLIRELLFGFRERNPFVFDEHSKGMEAEARVELADGTFIKFRRRKGRKNVVHGKFEATGETIDQDRLSLLLGNATLELYQNVFGFSLDELSAGQKSLAHANITEALYGSGVGGLTSFQRIQAELDSEANDLFTPKARTRTIHKILAEIKTLEKGIREKTIRPREYEKWIESRDELEKVVGLKREELDLLRAREQHFQRLSDAIEPWLELVSTKKELDSLNIPDDFPHDGQVLFDKLVSRREDITDDLSEYKDELIEIEDQLSRIELEPELIEHAPEIKALSRKLSEVEGFRRDIPLREQESTAKKTEIMSQLRELNPDWDLSQLDQFHTGLAQRDTVERLRAEYDELDESRRELTRDRKRIADELETMTYEIESLQSNEPSAELDTLAEQAVNRETDTRRLSELRDQLLSNQVEIESLVEQLSSPLDISIEPDDKSSLPLEATAVEFQDRLEQARQESRQAGDRRQQINDELEQIRDDLAELDAEVLVPDREQLVARRAHRDEGWKFIRLRFIDSEEPSQKQIDTWLSGTDESLPDEYEHEVAKADRIADERQERSQTAAKRDQLVARIDRLEKKLTESEAVLSEKEEHEEQVWSEWSELWSTCPFEPLSPSAMIAWLKHYESFRKAREAARLSGEKIEQLEERVNSFDEQVREVLGQASSDPEVLLKQLKDQVAQDRKVATQHETLQDQIANKSIEAENLEKNLCALDEKTDDWVHRWREVLDQFGFPKSWDVHLATRILTGLSAARSEYEKAESLDVRIAEMQEGLEQFELEVDSLRIDIAKDLEAMPPEDAAIELSSRHDTAKQNAQNHKKLVVDQEKLNRRIAKKENDLESVEAEIDVLLSVADADSERELVEVAKRVTKYAELKMANEDAKKQIRIARSTDDAKEFKKELQKADADSIAADQRELQTQISQLEMSYDETHASFTLAKSKVDQLDGRSRAAELAIELESSRSQLENAVDRWAPLVLAQALMKRAIERFEREHQPAMLKEVERLFCRMTADRYTTVQRKLDEQGTLQVVENDGKLKEPHELSTGTRQQLFLAIRLAYINHYCRDTEPLPIVMDDVLVNFDDDRFLQTIHVLREIAESVQIIFLTCHNHMVDRIGEAIPDCKPIFLSK